jgi:hypothetical protein
MTFGLLIAREKSHNDAKMVAKSSKASEVNIGGNAQ